MEEKVFPPKKDHIATYKRYTLLRICAETDLEMYLAQSNSLEANIDPAKAKEIEILISKQRAFIEKLDLIIRKFGDALYMFAKSYGAPEYSIFGLLFIKNMSPQDVAYKTHRAVSYIYNLQSKFKKDLRDMELE